MAGWSKSSKLDGGGCPLPHSYVSSLVRVELSVQIGKSFLKHGTVLWVRSNIQLLEDVLSGKLQALPSLLL